MESDVLDQMKKLYSYDRWLGEAGQTEQLFLWHYMLKADVLPEWSLERLRTMKMPGSQRYTQTLWRQLSGLDTTLRVDTYECSSRIEAREFLLRMLGNTERPLERWKDSPVGDVAFAPPTGAAALFMRGNMVVWIARLETPPLQVAEFAQCVDTDFLRKPASVTEDAGGNLIRKLEFMHPQPMPGSDEPLRLELHEGLEETPSCKFFSKGGELFEKDSSLFFRAVPHCAPEIKLYVNQGDHAASYRSVCFSSQET